MIPINVPDFASDAIVKLSLCWLCASTEWDKDELIKILEYAGIKADRQQVFTCGSGVTACILAMANKIINDKNPIIYDSSWSEYGLK